MAVNALRLFGVAALHERDGGALAPQTSLVTVRDLGAVVRAAPFRGVEMSDRELEDYRQVIDRVFEETTILPAPFGTVFRSGDQLHRWLRAHYIALTEGVHLVQGRCEMRVHVAPRRDQVSAEPAPPPASEAEKAKAEEKLWADVNARAAEIFRQLRRNVAASVPLRPSQPATSCAYAFLVERASWREFGEAVEAQAGRADGLRVDASGPWPPYDFVRMDLGG